MKTPLATLTLSTIFLMSVQPGLTNSSLIHNEWFDGITSRLSVAIGAAEGTRSINGQKTKAYAGHYDPGNGVWNIGTFSFQHCGEPGYKCNYPWDADYFQLARIRGFATKYLNEPELTELEFVNACDLFNQAPLAAKDFTMWLSKAKSQGMTGSDAIHYARVMSFYSPTKGRLDAPGLGNSWQRVRDDQARRMSQIEKVLTTYEEPVG